MKMTQYFFSEYYIQNVGIEEFNVLVDKKWFFDTPIKNEEETYKKFIEMGINNDYTISNLLNYENFSKYYKVIAN